MRIGRWCCVSLVGLAGAGCFPSRDNPLDPAIAPKARLVIANMGPGEVCPPTEILPFYNTASDVSRGQCLALDARSSTDPQGRTTLRKFRFELPGIDAFEIDEMAVRSDGGYVILSRDFREALPTDTPIEFSVKVTDRDGNFGRATASVVLRNAAPIPRISVGGSIPEGGLPWAIGVPVPFRFDGSASTDPDGDELRWCWSAPGTPESCGSEPEFAYAAPTDPGRYVVRLRVKDALEGEIADGNSRVSRAEYAAVWVEPPVLWEATSLGELVRTDRTAFPSIQAGVGAAAFHGPLVLPPVIVTEIGTPRRLRPFSYPEPFTMGTDYVVPGNPAMASHLLSNPDRDEVWVLRQTGSDLILGTKDFQVEVYRPTGTSIMLLGSALSTVVSGSRGVGFALSRGAGWLTAANPTLSSFSGPGLAPQTETLDAPAIDMAGRPETDEMWILVQEDDGTAFRRYLGSDGGAPGQIDLGELFASGFGWRDSTEFWLLTVERGLIRVDANVLQEMVDAGLSGASALDFATTAAIFPFFEGGGDMLIDRAVGEIWMSNIRVGAELERHYNVTLPKFIDSDGYPWTTGNGLHRVRSTDYLEKHLEVVTSPFGGANPSVDLARGSVWLNVSDPPSILEVTSEGLLGRRFPLLSLPGGVDQVPPFGALTVSPDGSSMWAAQTAGNLATIYHIDLAGPTPPAATIAEVIDVGVAGESLYDYAGFHASAGAAASFVWTTIADPTDIYPVRIGQSGPPIADTGVSVSSQFGDSIAIARSLIDNGLCIATLERVSLGGLNFQLTHRLYRAVPGSTAQPLDFRQFNYVGGAGGGSSYDIPFVAATRSPSGGEMCWSGYVETTNPATNEELTVYGADTTGTIRSFVYTALNGVDVRSVVPTGPDEVLYLRDDQRVRRHTPNGAGVLTTETIVNFVDPLGDQGTLLWPEAKTFF